MSPEAGSSTKTEESLLDRVRSGDPDAWRTFVERHEGSVAATVIGMVGRGPDAEDIGQEVFIRFFRNAATFRGDADVKTYLTRSAINLSLNAIKRRQRMRRWFADPTDAAVGALEGSAGDAPDRALERSQLAEQVSAAIRSLKPDFRSVAVLRLVRGLSTSETAAVLSIPEGTVMSRLSRAQKALRERLKGVVADG